MTVTATPDPRDLDTRMRHFAFVHVRRLTESRGLLTASDLRAGFTFEGERVPLHNPQRGIFKPGQMQFLLSIKTVYPKPGGKVWYDDQRAVHRQIFEGEEAVDYAFMGKDPDAADNRWLRDAYQNQVPVIYFLGVSPGQYQAVIPTFISGWDPVACKARVTFGMYGREELKPPSRVEDRRYVLHTVKQRLHQGSFREAVIAAYRGRCVLSGLRERQLLDAAHIVPDTDETLGQPTVTNGLLLSKLHHAAFDRHLIGVDQDYRVHVSERLLEQRDGPMLEALRQLQGSRLSRLPQRSEDRPDRDRLAKRFECFRSVA